MLVVVLRPRESRCLTIRLTGQNNCGTIGLSSLEKTPLIEDDDEHEDEDEDSNSEFRLKPSSKTLRVGRFMKCRMVKDRRISGGKEVTRSSGK